MIAVVDTNILIDYLNGEKQAQDELKKYDEVVISIITWIEVLVGIKDSSKIEVVKNFLNSFRISTIDLGIANSLIQLRQQYKLKLPDAIIWATAKQNNSLLVTRDEEAFNLNLPDIRIPYKI